MEDPGLRARLQDPSVVRQSGRVTIADVAALAEVSRSTVSNYLNSPGRLSDARRTRIHNAIEHLGYVPSDAARQLRAGDSKTFGYVAFEVGNAFFAESADAIEHAVSDEGLHLLLANTSGSLEREAEYLELFEQQRVRGVIVAPIGNVEPTLLRMRRNGIESVITGRIAHTADQPSVSVDDVKGGYLAVKHLLEVGRRRIAFVGGPLGIEQIGSRLTGASEAIAEYPDATLEVVLTAERGVKDGLAIGGGFASRSPAARPDGVFAVNDLVAVGVVQALTENSRIKVPRDIAVVGYDNVRLDGSQSLPITTINHPHAESARVAVKLLLDEISGGGRGQKQIVFDPELIIRASSMDEAT